MAIETLAEEVVNEVATNLEEAAEVTRKLNTAGLGYLAIGLGVGAAVGFYFGYKFNREKLRAEAYKEAEVEVAQLRTIYLEKTINTPEAPPEGFLIEEKPSIEQIVQERGYSAPIPERERPLRAPVPILDDLPDDPKGTSKSMHAGWNYEEELKNRTPQAPYVIHQNEFNHSNPDYSKVVYSFYDVDEILVDAEDEGLISYADVTVGMDNLKFGHGSDDIDVVYVRNDRLEMDMQICRVHASFDETMREMQSGVRDDDDDDDS